MTSGVIIDMWVVFKARSRRRKSQKTEPGWRRHARGQWDTTEDIGTSHEWGPRGGRCPGSRWVCFMEGVNDGVKCCWAAEQRKS